MPNTYYDLAYLKVQVTNKDGKLEETTHWITIGKGYIAENGRIDVRLDALPLRVSADTRFALFPHAWKENRSKKQES